MEKLLNWVRAVLLALLGMLIIGVYVGYITPNKPSIFVIGVLAVAGGATRLVSLVAEHFKTEEEGDFSQYLRDSKPDKV